MNGRIYDPLLGRFLSADTYVDGPADLQGYNRYSYVHNNPLSKRDPTGYESEEMKKLRRFEREHEKIDRHAKPAGLLPAKGAETTFAAQLNTSESKAASPTAPAAENLSRDAPEDGNNRVLDPDRPPVADTDDSDVAQGEDRLVVGIYGAGGENSGNNPQLRRIVEGAGGTMYDRSQADEIIALIKERAGADVTLIGYSRGGQTAVEIANALGADNVRIGTLITFDPHRLAGGLQLQYDNVGSAFNYYQRNSATGVLGLPFGNNPYRGRPVTSSHITVGGVNYTGNSNVNHINIVSYAYANQPELRALFPVPGGP